MKNTKNGSHKKIKSKISVNNKFFRELMEKENVVKILYRKESRSTNYFRGVIISVKNNILTLYNERNAIEITVEIKDLIALRGPRIEQPIVPSYNPGLKSMKRRGKEDKRSYREKFSYSKWWKNENIEE